MTDQPTQPLTDDELAEIKRRALPSAPEYRMYAVIDRAHLIREVDRLRAENTALAERLGAVTTAWLNAENAWLNGVTSQLSRGAVDLYVAAVRRALGLDQDGGQSNG